MSNNLHVFPFEKFTAAYIDAINSHYRTGHTFLVYGRYKDISIDLQRRDNVIFCPSLQRFFFSHEGKVLFSKARKIILHSLAGPAAQVFVVSPWLWNKLYVCFWGYEIYGFRDKKPGVRNVLYRRSIAAIAKNAKGIITLMPKDADILERYVPFTGKRFTVCYCPDERKKKSIMEAGREGSKTTSPYRFLLGNNAMPSNNHIEMLEKLSTYKGEEFEVLTPLSYGAEDGRDYLDKVMNAGQTLLGNAFVPLLDFLPEDAYYQKLADCTVGFFNNDRQQAIGNVDVLALLGAKLYLRSSTVMWDDFVITRGYHFFDISQTGEIPFQELVLFGDEQRAANRNRMDNETSVAYMVEKWERVFSD